MTDTLLLLDYMGELNKDPGAPVTNAQLIHVIHLTLGAITESIQVNIDGRDD